MIKPSFFPICSMYGIFTYMGNVGKYSIHGASGFLNNLLVTPLAAFPSEKHVTTRGRFTHQKLSQRETSLSFHLDVPLEVSINGDGFWSMGYNSPTYIYWGVIAHWSNHHWSQHFLGPGHPKCGIQPAPSKGSLSRSQCQLWSSMSMAIGSGNTGGTGEVNMQNPAGQVWPNLENQRWKWMDLSKLLIYCS